MQPTTQPFTWQQAPTQNEGYFNLPQSGGNSGGISGFLKNNLSTIGSIGLPLLGAALAPETGGLSLAALAGLGGGGGKLLQNLSEGKGTGSAGSILGAAGQGVAGDLTGQVLGAGLKLAGGIPSSLIAKGAAKATDTAATKEALAAEAPFSGVNPTILDNTNMQGLIKHVQDFGGTPTPQTMKAMSALNTGSSDLGGIVSGTNRQILDTLPAIDTNPAVAAARQALSGEGGPLGEVGTQSTKAGGILNSLRRSIQTTSAPGSEGGITNANINRGIQSSNDIPLTPELRQQIIDNYTPSSITDTNRNIIGAGAEGANAQIPGTHYNFRTYPTGKVSTTKIISGETPSLSQESVQGTPQYIKDAINNAQSSKDLVGIRGNLSPDLSNKLFGTVTNGGQTGMVDANSVLDTIQQLEDRAKSLNATNGYEATAEARATTAAANALKDQLSKSGVDKAVAAYKLTPEDIAAIHQRAAATGVPAQYADHIVNGINDATTFNQMRALQEPAVRMGQLSDAAIKDAGGALTKAPSSGGMSGLSNVYEAGSLAHGNLAAAIPLGAKAATAPVVGPSLIKANDLIQGIRGLNTFNGNMPGALTAGKILSRVAGQNIAGTGKGQAAAAPTVAPDMNVAGDGATNTPTATPQDQSQGMQPQAPAFGQDQMLAAIAADPKNASTYLQLYNAVGKPAEALTTSQKNEVTGAQKAQQVLGDYANQLQSVGGGKGIIGGNVENILGKLIPGGNNSAANALESNRQDVAVSVAGALTPTGRPTTTLINQIANSLPSIKDTSTTAQHKFQFLMDRIKNGELSANQPLGTTSVSGS